MQEQNDSKSENTGKDKVAITKKMTTGEVTERYPATKEVFSKYFGKSCFDCPAFGTEDINLACMMHNTDVDKFVGELIEAAQKEIDSKVS
jgi:hybrid cluster-associated redox disulfide protein